MLSCSRNTNRYFDLNFFIKSFCFWICITPLCLLLVCQITALGLNVAEEDPWVILEKRGAIISRIEIQVSDVFNLQYPKENHVIAHVANFIHVETWEKSILPALLFKEKNTVNALLIHATERLLRDLPYVRDAEIVPVVNPNGMVTAIVRIHDAWSLKLGLIFKHVGGESEWNIKLEEMNMLGWGKQLHVSHEKTIDRSFNKIWYSDPFFVNTRWNFLFKYQQLSDGVSRLLKINSPFYDIYTPWSAGFEISRSKYNETFFETGSPVYSFPSHQYSFSVYNHYLVWKKKRTAQRLGMEIRATRRYYGPLTIYKSGVLPFFDISERHFLGIMGYWAFFQDAYHTLQTIIVINRVEYFNLGWDVYIRIGYFPQAFGSVRKMLYTEGSIQKGFDVDENSFLLWNTQWHGRKEGPHFRNFWYQNSISFFDQRFRYQTLICSMQGSFSSRPDPEGVMYIGGINGLRGYMNYFKSGDARWMLSLEDRVVTPWNLWGLLQVGFVGYFDIGSARELGSGYWSKIYASVGAGLRFGNLKSSIGRVIHLTIAFPLVREPGVRIFQIVFGEVDKNNQTYSIDP